MADEIRQVLGFDVNDAVTNLERFGNSLSNVSGRLTRFAKNLDRFNATTDSGATGLTQTGSAATRLGQTLERTEKHVGRLTTSVELLSRIVYTQLVIKGLRLTEQALLNATKRFADLEIQLARIETIAGGRFNGLPDILAEVNGLSRFSGIDQLEVAAGLYQSISNQIQGTRDQLREFNEVAAQFSVITGTDLKDSVNLISGTLNSFNVSVARAEEFAAKFVKTMELGRVLGPELATAFGRVDTQAALLGVTFDELNAAFQTITITGVKASEAATLIRGIFQGLTKPTEDLKKALRELNVPSSQFLIQARGLSGALSDIASTTDGSAASLARLFPNIRGLNGELILAISRQEKFNQNLKETQQTSAALLKQRFLQVFETDAARVRREANELQIGLSSLGQQILALTARAIDSVGGVDELARAFRVATPAVLGASAALIQARLQLSGIATQAVTLRSLFSGLGKVNPLFALGAGLTAVTLGFELLEQHSLQAIRKIEGEHRRTSEAFLKSERARVRAAREADDEILRSRADTARASFAEFARVEDAVRAAESALELRAKNSLARLLDIRKAQVREFQTFAEQSANAVIQSQEKVRSLEFTLEEREFQQQLRRAGSEQRQFSLLLQRANELSRRASQQLAGASSTREIDLGRNLFQEAERAAQSAQQIAERLDSRRLESRAVETLNSITRRQIRDEQSLQRIKSKSVEADQSRLVAASERSDRLEANIARVLDNLSVAGKTEAELRKQATERQSALRDILQDAFSGDDLSEAAALGLDRLRSDIERSLGSEIPLAFSIERGMQTLQQRLSAAFDNYTIDIGVSIANLERLAGRDIARTPDAISNAQRDLKEERDRLMEAETEANAALVNAQRDFDTRFQKQVDQTRTLTNNLASAASTAFKFAVGLDFGVKDDLGEALARLQVARQELERLASIDPAQVTEERLAQVVNLIDRAKDLSGTTFERDITALGNAAELLRARTEALAHQDEKRVQRINELTAGLGLSVEGSIKAGADYLRDQIEAGLRTGETRNRQFGGLSHFANGGLARGTDTVPAMLTRGEFVVNHSASQRFFSDLQRMNAGMTPQYRNAGGPVDNSISVGDVHIHGSAQTMTPRDVARAIGREVRRNTVRR